MLPNLNEKTALDSSLVNGVSSADLTASAGQKISTRAQDGFTEANIAQAYDDGEMVRVDLMDVQAERLLAAIRFIRADDKAGPLQIGYVQLPDTAPIAITCEGP